MEMKQLETFCMIVETGSFSKAASKLQYAPSTITLHIQLLEEELDALLFDRLGKRVILTDIGKEFYIHARSVVQQMDRLQLSMRELIQEGTSQVAIGSVEPTASSNLPSQLQQFLERYPRAKMTMETGGTISLCERVSKGYLAFAITTTPPKNSNLTFEPLFKEPLALLLPINHELSSQESITLNQLTDTPFLLTETGCAYREEIERVFSLKGIQLQTKAEIGSGQVIKRCVQLGMGVAILPALSVTDPPQDTVVRVVADAELSLMTGITYCSGRNWSSVEKELFLQIKNGLIVQYR